MDVTVSLAQFTPILGQPSANLDRVRPMAAEAARRGSNILLLPELWNTGYDLERAAVLANENQTLLPELGRLAQEHRLYIGGSLLYPHSEYVRNTFFLFTPDGGDPVEYSKIHLFRLMDEDRWLSPGDSLRDFTAPWGHTALAVCYDLRFPELFRQYFLRGAELLLICAEWPSARIDHWQTLLRARAIENQMFVCGTNAVGPCGGEMFGGRSAIISPWGKTLVEGSLDQEDLLTTVIDLGQAAQARERIPVRNDRRPDLYQAS